MMTSWMKALDNPVFVKEMRVGFREKKVFYALMAWVVIVALVASLCSLASFDSNQGIDNLPEAGIFFMEALFWLQMGLLAMLAPSLTTSAVSGERERNCFDMLLTTHLSPSELVFGKFGFAASFITLALFSTIPLEAIVFFLGGVSITSFLYSKLILCSFGLLCSLYGLVMSSREHRSSYATGQTYLGLIFLCWLASLPLAGLRYAPDVPTFAYVIAALVCLYLGLFLFWKAVNHLEERARHLKIILSIGLVFYLIFLGIAIWSQYWVPGFDHDIWIASGPLHFLLLGLLLNPMRPSRKIEQRRFSQSLLSRPVFWSIILGSGLMLPLLDCDSEEAIAICTFALLSGLSISWFARGLSLKSPSRYPQILGACWLLLNVVPAFTAIEEWERGNHMWHPATISPFMMLIEYADHEPTVFPVLAFCFYGLLLTIGVVLHIREKAKRRDNVKA